MPDVSEIPKDTESDLDSLDFSPYGLEAETIGDFQEVESDDDVDDTVETVLFTATNPEGTVSVTALMNGQILRVSLSSAVVTMTESALTHEILVVASMARLQALAGQHAIIAALMRRLGRDPAATRSFLERNLGLPAPGSVNEARAKVYAGRYDGEPE